jgi:S1-C subfamily serine protease
MLGDLVALVGDQPIIDVDSLRAQLTSDKLGQTLPVRIIRGGEAQNLTITLGERQ